MKSMGEEMKKLRFHEVNIRQSIEGKQETEILAAINTKIVAGKTRPNCHHV